MVTSQSAKERALSWHLKNNEKLIKILQKIHEESILGRFSIVEENLNDNVIQPLIALGFSISHTADDGTEYTTIFFYG